VNFFKFLGSRLITFFMVVFIGVTTVFFVPRFMPTSPVEAMIGKLTSRASTMDPVAVMTLRESLNESFGLNGSLSSQYFGFLKRVLITHDFGPSLTAYPTPVIEMIGRALPWTFGLLLTSTLIAWFFGNLIGLIAGFRRKTVYSKILESIAIVFYPIPYYIFALALIMLFCFVFPVFPLTFTIVGSPATLAYWQNILRNAFLPGLSIILTGFGWWVISMKTISTGISEEDYIFFARLKGLSETKVMTNYVLPNATLPQITFLALQMGTIFNGALITEMLFGYPGVGSLIYYGILQADYNLIMGTISISIIAVATATLIVDLLYPFFDPRIRYK
jgi:peptide/nickel transport system permease protein